LAGTIRISVKAFFVSLAAIPIIVAMLLLPVSITRSQLIHDEWAKLASAFVEIRHMSPDFSDPSLFSYMANHHLFQIRVIEADGGSARPRERVLTYAPLDRPPQCFLIAENNGFSQLYETTVMVFSLRSDPIELIGPIEGGLVGFTIDQSRHPQCAQFGHSGVGCADAFGRHQCPQIGAAHPAVT
jgi:hypothetical protein